MSNIFKSENLDKDFIAFQEALNKTNIQLHTISNENRVSLKRYHRLTYIIALFENKLETKWKGHENKFLFLNELLSDLLANCSLSLIGFQHSSLIITRRLLENFYNHIFYFEHPVEFELLNLGRNDYTPIVELKNYFESHPVVKPLLDKNIKIFNDQVFYHYQELCRTVHTKGEDFMGLAKNIDEIKPAFNFIDHLTLVNKSTQSIIYLLYKFHRDLKFTNIETDLISKTFTKSLRSSLLS